MKKFVTSLAVIASLFLGGVSVAQAQEPPKYLVVNTYTDTTKCLDTDAIKAVVNMPGGMAQLNSENTKYLLLSLIKNGVDVPAEHEEFYGTVIKANAGSVMFMFAMKVGEGYRSCLSVIVSDPELNAQIAKDFNEIKGRTANGA